MGVYVHWPFCLSKCPYCDFNSHVFKQIDQERWRDAYLQVLDYYRALLPGRQVVSIYFGGGTPSLMPPETVEAIIYQIQKNWPVANDIEITLEANPTSVEIDKFRAFQQAGVNRVSVGVQALKAEDLKFLGRRHSVDEGLRAIETARDVFDRYNFDLIYARPNQNLKEWQQELESALQYAGNHLSLYQLTIEQNTPFYKSYSKGGFSLPHEELAADFYNLTQEVLEAVDLPAYEVSNHARAGQESSHNMIYWMYGDYIGVGPGAHGRFLQDGHKYTSQEYAAPKDWIEKVYAQHGGGAQHYPFEIIPPKDRLIEALMMGLRVRGGVRFDRLREVSGFEPDYDLGRYIDFSKAKTLAEEGWLECSDDSMRLTREGWLRMNAILPFILKNND